jgi:nucleotide-binding universal stress UspA family protein
MLTDAPILVGTDGSETAARAVTYASELAQRLGVELHIGVAYRSGDEEADDSADAPDDVEWQLAPRSEAESVSEEAAKAASGDGSRPPVHVCEGAPDDVLVELAKEIGAQLLVVGNKGMTGASRFLGSVPNRVSHTAGCSVLIVRTDD